MRVAIQASHAAGRVLAARMGRPRTVRTKRSAIDLVTEVDRASEQLIYRAIRRHFPAHGFQGEEQTRANPDAPYQWIVDPLDGTMNFVHGVPAFAVSIALWHQGKPLVGVIYDPCRRETFTAIHRQGAWCNGRRIHVSRAASLAQGLLSTGFPSNFRVRPQPYLRWFAAFQSRCHGVRRIGSTAISLAYVACGRHDGFYEQDLWPWDLAAGVLLVREAGGRTSDFYGHPVRVEAGQVVASNGLLHRQMLRCLAPLIPRQYTQTRPR